MMIDRPTSFVNLLTY